MNKNELLAALEEIKLNAQPGFLEDCHIALDTLIARIKEEPITPKYVVPCPVCSHPAVELPSSTIGAPAFKPVEPEVLAEGWLAEEDVAVAALNDHVAVWMNVEWAKGHGYHFRRVRIVEAP